MKVPVFNGVCIVSRRRLTAATIVASLSILSSLAMSRVLPAQGGGNMFPATELDRELETPGAGQVQEELPPTIAKPRPTRPPHPHRPETAEPAAPQIEEIPAPQPHIEPGSAIVPPQHEGQPIVPPANSGFYGDTPLEQGGVVEQPTAPAPVENVTPSLTLPEISPLAPPANTLPPHAVVNPPAGNAAGWWTTAVAGPLLPGSRPVGVTLEQLIDRTLRISPILRAAADRSRTLQLSQGSIAGAVVGGPGIAVPVAPAPRLRRWGCAGHCAGCCPPSPCAGGCLGGPCAGGACAGGFRGNTACVGACNGGGCNAGCNRGCGVAGGCGVSRFHGEVHPGCHAGFAPAPAPRAVAFDAGRARYEFRMTVENHIQAVIRAYWTLAMQRGLLVQRRRLHHDAVAVLQNSGDQSPAASAAIARWKDDLCRAEANVFNAQDQLVRLVGDLHLLTGGVELIPTSAAPAVCAAPDVEQTVAVAVARRGVQNAASHHQIAMQVRKLAHDVEIASTAIQKRRLACEFANANRNHMQHGFYSPQQLVAAHQRVASEEAALLMAQMHHAIAIAGIQRSIGILGSDCSPRLR